MPWPLSDDSERLSTVLALLEKIRGDGTKIGDTANTARSP
jgi:hypothetical protein